MLNNLDIADTIRLCDKNTICDVYDNTSFFLGRETILPGKNLAMSWWQTKIFIFQSINAGVPSNYFDLPPNRVVKLGAQVIL